MISFVTLLLGLVSGPRPVEVAAAGEVAEVAILLDGAEVARLRGGERRAVVDFGPLAPHLLEAVARDAGGRELGRASQAVNLPRGAAAAEWAVESSAGGLPTVVRLVHETLWPGGVESIEATLDGARLEVGADGRVELPPYDPGEIHHLRGAVRFGSGAAATAELAFAGRFGDSVRTELTAVPLRATRGRPSVKTLAGSLAAGGRPLEVAAVDHGPADVILVRDAVSQEDLERLAVLVGLRYRSTRRELRQATAPLPLRDGTRVRFVWPVVVAPGAAGPPDPRAFAVERGLPAGRDGLFVLLRDVEPPAVPQAIADAVAVAADLVAAPGRPRAVVLALDPATPDVSEHDPCEVRAFLARLRVPLVVWTTGSADEVDPAWGEVAEIASWADLRRAVRHLREQLDSQTVAWVEGSWLPDRIVPAASPDAPVLAGADPGLAAECGGLSQQNER